ncbi:MAG: hypothetical protein R3F23_02175 [Verrucomicrobiia bacterium]
MALSKKTESPNQDSSSTEQQSKTLYERFVADIPADIKKMSYSQAQTEYRDLVDKQQSVYVEGRRRKMGTPTEELRMLQLNWKMKELAFKYKGTPPGVDGYIGYDNPASFDNVAHYRVKLDAIGKMASEDERLDKVKLSSTGKSSIRKNFTSQIPSEIKNMSEDDVIYSLAQLVVTENKEGKTFETSLRRLQLEWKYEEIKDKQFVDAQPFSQQKNLESHKADQRESIFSHRLNALKTEYPEQAQTQKAGAHPMGPGMARWIYESSKAQTPQPSVPGPKL